MLRLRARLVVPTALAAATLILGSCSHILETNEMPPLVSRSPLREVPPRTFAFKEFKDIRGTEDPMVLMKVGVHSFSLEDPPATLVAQWISQELERNGHRCVPYAPDVKADFVVDGTVFRFSVQRLPASGFRVSAIADTAVKLAISRLPGGEDSLTKSYQGHSSVTDMTLGVWKPAVHQALLAMIQDLSTDSDLVTFLRQ